MKALVIGASGHVGNAITRALLDRKWQVTACGRHKDPPINLAGLPVTYLAGDADTPGQLDRWVRSSRRWRRALPDVAGVPGPRTQARPFCRRGVENPAAARCSRQT